MSNSVLNQGLAPQFVAAESLRTLVPVLAPLKAIAVTDFGAYIAEKGNVVHTRFANKFTASEFNPANGFVSQNANATDVAITLENHRYTQASFTDTEVASISVEMLRRVFLAPLANSVVKSIFDDVIGQTTTANYATAAYSGSKASFNRIAIANVATSLTKANLPFDSRALLLSPDAFGQLLQDPTVAQYLSIGDTSVIRDSKVGRLHGIDIHEVNTFPSSGTVFTEGLNGIASCREGHVIVTRTVAAPTTGGGEQIQVTDTDSGFTYALRMYYNWQMGTTNISASWLSGHAVGNPDAAQRIAFTS